MPLKHINMRRRTLRTALPLIAWVATAAGTLGAQDLLDGYWESDGFGYAFVISGQSLRAFEVTATTCVASSTARRQRGSKPGNELTFRSTEARIASAAVKLPTLGSSGKRKP